MRGPVFLRTGSNPSLTPPPAPPRSEAFPGEASRPTPAARLRSARRARDSSIPQAVRAAGGGGARGEGAERRYGRGAGPGGWVPGAGRRGEFLARGPHALRAIPEPASSCVCRTRDTS